MFCYLLSGLIGKVIELLGLKDGTYGFIDIPGILVFILDKSENLTSNGFLLFLINACSFNSLIDNKAASLVKNLTNANYLDFPLESIAILTYSNLP